MSESLDINHVRVGDRHRKDFGDLDALAASIKEVGLLGPIIVDADNNLVAGHRRLEACRSLGFPNVPVRRVRQINDAVSALKAERDENTCRKDFTPSEAVALGLALEELERPAAEERQTIGRSIGGRLKNGQVLDGQRPSSTQRGSVRDVVAPAVGLAPRTYARAKTVVEATTDPDPAVAEAATAAMAEMDATGNVSAAERKVKAARGTLTIKDKIDGAVEHHPKNGEARAAKVAKAQSMAAEGYTSRQIAAALALTVESFANFRRDHAVEVPADAVVGKSRNLDSNRIVEALALGAVNITAGVELISYAELDRSRLEEWASSLSDAIRSLTTIRNTLQKELTRER